MGLAFITALGRISAFAFAKLTPFLCINLIRNFTETQVSSAFGYAFATSVLAIRCGQNLNISSAGITISRSR